MRIPIMKESHHGSGTTEPTLTGAFTDPVEAKHRKLRRYPKTLVKSEIN